MSSLMVEPMPTETWERFVGEIDEITGRVASVPVPSFPTKRTTYGWARVVLWVASLRPGR